LQRSSFVQSLCAAPENHPLLRVHTLDDPDAIRLWQRTLCDISRSRSNPHLAPRHQRDSRARLKTEEIYRATKISPVSGHRLQVVRGSADDFPRLRIRVRDEIVSFGAADELSVDRRGVVGGGVHLKPDDVTSWSSNEATTSSSLTRETPSKPQSAVSRTPSFQRARDARLRVGARQRTIRPSQAQSRRHVLYGGVRCEVLSALMIKRGFEEVYQLDEASCATAKPSATTASGRARCTSSTHDASRVQRAHEDNRHVRTMRGSHESVPQLREPGCRKLILLCGDCELDKSVRTARRSTLRTRGRQCERARRRTKRLKGKSSRAKLAGGFLTITGTGK